MATSVFTTGYAISGLVWPILYKLFLDADTWRGAFLLQVAIGINSFILIMIQTSKVVHVYQDDNSHTSKSKNSEEENEMMLGNLGDDENSKPMKILNVKRNGNFSLFNKAKKLFRTDLSMWDSLITLAYFLCNAGDTFSHYMTAVRMNYVDITREEIVFAMSARGALGLIRVLPTKVAGVLSFLTGLSTMISDTFTTFPTILIYFLAWGIMQCKL